MNTNRKTAPIRRGQAKRTSSFTVATATRRQVLGGLAVAGIVAGGSVRPARAADDDDGLTEELLFNDPEVPTGGNPDGELTIINFFDYNCPYCRRAMAPLDEVVEEDGDIRLVYKDWPILTPASETGAKLALAAHHQEEYVSAHHALMSLGGRADAEAMVAAVRGSGVDFGRLERDLEDHRPDIEALLTRNRNQARALGLRGTPSYIIGPFVVPSALDADGFRRVIADAREKPEG